MLDHKRVQGYVYGPVPFGCRRDGDILVTDDSEERTIELVLKLRSQGWNYSSIARELNDLGHRTKSAEAGGRGQSSSSRGARARGG